MPAAAALIEARHLREGVSTCNQFAYTDYAESIGCSEYAA